MQFLSGPQFGTKLELLEQLLAQGMVMLHLDSRRPEVDVPARHRGNPHLRLNVSLNFHLEHFEYDDVGVSAGLSFGGVRYHCVMPWSAIFAMNSHTESTGYIWPQDVPPELAHAVGATAKAPPKPAETPARPRFGVIRGGAAEPDPNRDPRDDYVITADDIWGDDDSMDDSMDDSIDDSMDESLDESDDEDAPQVAPAAAKPPAKPALAPAPKPSGDDDSDDPDDPNDGGGRRYGHLRVVK